MEFSETSSLSTKKLGLCSRSSFVADPITFVGLRIFLIPFKLSRLISKQTAWLIFFVLNWSVKNNFEDKIRINEFSLHQILICSESILLVNSIPLICIALVGARWLSG